MRTTVITVFVAVALAGSASAATYGGKAQDLSAPFATRLAAVCQSPTLVLTAPAKVACTTGAFPRLTATAAAFVNTGVGAELNTLMRQLPAAPTVAAK